VLVERDFYHLKKLVRPETFGPYYICSKDVDRSFEKPKFEISRKSVRWESLCSLQTDRFDGVLRSLR
jgi:hypothetical protein